MYFNKNLLQYAIYSLRLWLIFLVSPFLGTGRRLRKMGLSIPAVMQQPIKCCQLQQMCLTPAKHLLAGWPGILWLLSRQEYSLITF